MPPSRERDFLRLWIGQTISEIGSRISREGLPLTAVLVLGASPFQMGILAATGGVSVLLFGFFAGVLVDRSRRRPVMIVTDLLRAALLITVPIAAALNLLTMVQLLAVGALVGVCTVVFNVAYQSYLPRLMPPEELLDSNRKLMMTASAAEIVGPSLTGVLVQLITAPLAIAVDAVSFVVSAFSIVIIRTPEPGAQSSTGLPSWQEISEGARIVLHHPMLLPLALRAVSAFLFGGIMFGLYVLYAIRVLHLSTAALGFTIAMGGLGSFLGVYLSRVLSARYNAGTIFFASAAMIGATNLLVPAAALDLRFAIPCMAAGQFFGDSAWGLFAVSETTYRQQVTHPAVLGRVNAVMQVATQGMLPLGALLGGALAQVLGIVPTLWIAAAGMLGSSAWLLPVAFRNPAAAKAAAALDFSTRNSQSP